MKFINKIKRKIKDKIIGVVTRWMPPNEPIKPPLICAKEGKTIQFIVDYRDEFQKR